MFFLSSQLNFLNKVSNSISIQFPQQSIQSNSIQFPQCSIQDGSIHKKRKFSGRSKFRSKILYIRSFVGVIMLNYAFAQTYLSAVFRPKLLVRYFSVRTWLSQRVWRSVFVRNITARNYKSPSFLSEDDCPKFFRTRNFFDVTVIDERGMVPLPPYPQT